MTNHPNRSWRKRWTVERISRTAVHASGVTVRFAPSETRPDSHDQITIENIDRAPAGTDIGRLTEEACRLWAEEDRQ